MVIQLSIGVGCFSVYFSGPFFILGSHDLLTVTSKSGN